MRILFNKGILVFLGEIFQFFIANLSKRNLDSVFFGAILIKNSILFQIKKYEMTMKYSFEQFYVWYQYGLTLICDRKVKFIVFFKQKIFYLITKSIFLFKVQQSLSSLERV